MNELTAKRIPVETRLRKLFPDQTGRTRETIVEAADTIESLRAQVAALTLERDELQILADKFADKAGYFREAK